MKYIIELLYILLNPSEWEYFIVEILAFFIDPILERNKGFEDWLYRRKFDRLNAYCDKHPYNPEETERYYEQEQAKYNAWLMSEGFQDEEELFRNQEALFLKELNVKAKAPEQVLPDYFSEWGL